jgi:hypothetical protein
LPRSDNRSAPQVSCVSSDGATFPGPDPATPDAAIAGTAVSTNDWCNTAAQRAAWGGNLCPIAQGCPATGMDQGWKRDCDALCRKCVVPPYARAYYRAAFC